MLTQFRPWGRLMLAVADGGGGGGVKCHTLADVIC